MVPTVSRFDASPFRRIREMVFEVSGAQVMTKGWPGMRVVDEVTDVMTFDAAANAMKIDTTRAFAKYNILKTRDERETMAGKWPW